MAPHTEQPSEMVTALNNIAVQLKGAADALKQNAEATLENVQATKDATFASISVGRWN